MATARLLAPPLLKPPLQVEGAAVAQPSPVDSPRDPVRPGTFLRKASLVVDFFQVLALLLVATPTQPWPKYWEFVRSTYDWPAWIACASNREAYVAPPPPQTDTPPPTHIAPMAPIHV